jgi:site-specific DNA-methyltransferase (cytosine-N4-specific)
MKDGASNPKGTPDPKSVKPAYETPFGSVLEGKIEDALESEHLNRLKGKVNLILTSPPYPLVRKKQYGNSNGQEYLDWLSSLAVGLSDLLADDGSIVVEIGNAWEPGSPTMSTLPLEALMAFKRKANLNLCQHVICHNPASVNGGVKTDQRAAQK